MILYEEDTADDHSCAQCGVAITPGVKFCGGCGVRQIPEKNNETESNWTLLKQAALFYAISIVICALCNFVEYFKTFSWFLIFNLVLAFSATVFFALDWSTNKALLTWKSFSLSKLLLYGMIAMFASVIVHYSVGWLNVTIFPKEVIYYSFHNKTLYTKALLIFFTAITPALFEELAFRGYVMQSLLKVADRQQAIYVSSFLFAILHLSIISLFWLIPFALFLGFIRMRENTLWYGIFIHFCFNLTACIFMLA